MPPAAHSAADSRRGCIPFLPDTLRPDPGPAADPPGVSPTARLRHIRLACLLLVAVFALLALLARAAWHGAEATEPPPPVPLVAGLFLVRAFPGPDGA